MEIKKCRRSVILKRHQPKCGQIYSPGASQQRYGSFISFSHQAQDDPLAKALFDVDHVVSVFYMDRMITVEKDDEGDWDDLLPTLAVPIRAAESVASPTVRRRRPEQRWRFDCGRNQRRSAPAKNQRHSG